MTIPEAIQRNLIFYLVEEKMSQTELAEKADVAQSSIHDLVYGKTKNGGGVASLWRVAKALNVGVDDLLKGAE